MGGQLGNRQHALNRFACGGGDVGGNSHAGFHILDRPHHLLYRRQLHVRAVGQLSGGIEFLAGVFFL